MPKTISATPASRCWRIAGSCSARSTSSATTIRPISQSGVGMRTIKDGLLGSVIGAASRKLGERITTRSAPRADEIEDDEE